jgi:hypothetical protein
MTSNVVNFPRRTPLSDEHENGIVGSLIAELRVDTGWADEPTTPQEQAADCLRVLGDIGKEMTWKLELAATALRALSTAMDQITPSQQQQALDQVGKHAALAVIMAIAGRTAGDYELELADLRQSAS